MRQPISDLRPIVHTAVIDDPIAMWTKLAWDVDVFEDIQRRMPKETQPLAFAAINACIAADSLNYWARHWWQEKHGRERLQEFDQLVASKVPLHAICNAIAGTAKHARHREGNWQGGNVSLIWNDGDEDWPSGFELHYEYKGLPATAFKVLNGVCGEWWSFLYFIGAVASETPPTPEWLHNKLNRIFGVQAPPPPSSEGGL